LIKEKEKRWEEKRRKGKRREELLGRVE